MLNLIKARIREFIFGTTRDRRDFPVHSYGPIKVHVVEKDCSIRYGVRSRSPAVNDPLKRELFEVIDMGTGICDAGDIYSDFDQAWRQAKLYNERGTNQIGYS